MADNTIITGEIDGLVGQGVAGWALRPSMPELRLWVEAFADGVSLGTGRAEHFHPLAASHGDGCYGFWIPVPAALLEQPVEIGAYLANTGEPVGSPVFIKPADKESSRLSHVTSDNGLRCSGWVMDPYAPNAIVQVSAKFRGKELVSVKASEPRFSPAQCNGHGFTLTLPWEMADGKPREIDVVDENDVPLWGSPILVQAFPEKFSDWIRRSVKMDKKQKPLLEETFARYEALLPRSAGFSCYPQWKKSFPCELAGGDPKGIHVCPHDASYAQVKNIAANARAVVLIAQNETLLPKSLEYMAYALDSDSSALVYGDSEMETPDGVVPLCKPAWDPYLYYGYDYLGPVLVDSQVILNTSLAKDLSFWALRTYLVLAACKKGVSHIPFPVSRCTCCPADESEQNQRRQILQKELSGTTPGIAVVPHPGHPDLNRICYPVYGSPLVSIIIPTRDRADLLQVCLDSLWQVSEYLHVEILIVDNGSVDQETKDLFDQAKSKGARLLSYPYPFNYSAMNNMAARQARGEYLCFLNNDTQVISPDWLSQMLGLAQQEAAGCVGAKLLWPNNLVQHGGVVVGVHELAAHVGNTWFDNVPGYMNRNQLTQQWSTVTAACMLTARSVFLDMGGFDELNFPVAFNDVDYCLRLRKNGKKILWTPWACLYHHESASRGKDVSASQQARNTMEMQNFRAKWGQYQDPFYNPNLTLSALVYPFDGLALPPYKRKIRT